VTRALEQGQSSAAAIAAWLGGDRLALDRHRAQAEADYHAHLVARRAYYAVPGLSRSPFWRERSMSSAPVASTGRPTPAPWWPMAIPGLPRTSPDAARSEPALSSRVPA
jgi:hypothetical protein